MCPVSSYLQEKTDSHDNVLYLQIDNQLIGEKSETNLLEENLSSHYSVPIIRTSTEQKFRDLAATWEYNNANVSSFSQIILEPAYQEIIGMGKDALPYIFCELNTAPNLWFWALKAITGVDPVRVEHKGHINKMVSDWLEWAKSNNYIK